MPKKNAIAKNPIDGNEYNLLPLFQYLKSREKTLEDITREIENHCDNIVQIIPPDDAYSVRETKDLHHFLVELKQVFRKIERVG